MPSRRSPPIRGWAAVELHDQFVELLDEDTAPYYAAEVNGDSAIDSADAGAIELHDQFVELLSDQNVLAEAFNSAW